MRTSKEMNTVTEAILGQIGESMDKLAEVRAASISGVVGKDADAISEAVSGLLSNIGALLGTVSYEDVKLSDYIAKFGIGENGDDIQFVVRTRQKSEYKKSDETVIALSDPEFVTKVAAFYTNFLISLMTLAEAKKNIAELNDYIKNVTTENEIGYEVAFDIAEGGAYVVSIDDHKIVLNTTVEDAFKIPGLSIFSAGDDYSDYVCAEANRKFVDALKACPNTVSVIKGNVPVVTQLCGTIVRRRADVILRRTYHRNARYIDQVKTGIGYFQEEVDGTKVFALVEKAEDGTKSVILHPFDVSTMLPVEADVLGIIA